MEAAGGHQGRAGPAVHADVLRAALRGPLGPAGGDRRWRAGDGPRRRAGRAGVAARSGRCPGRRRQRHARVRAARPRRRARRGQGRRPGQGDRARPRRLPRRRPAGACGARREDRRGEEERKAGRRLRHRLHRRPLPARRPCIGNLDAGDGRGRGCRSGRQQPLFQGPARQAGRHRQHLSRRHLQGGGRAVHPQRHVARGARECAGAGRCPARNLARGRRPRPPGGDAGPQPAARRSGRRDPGRQWRPRQGGARPEAGRQDRRAARIRGAAGRAWRQG